jgi:hypothetical protein
MRHHFLSLIASLFLLMQGNAQDIEKVKEPFKDPLPVFSIRGSVSIPKIVGSQAFRISFLGAYDASLTFNFRLGKQFTIGIGYQNAIFTQTSFFKYKGLDTRLQCNNGLVRLGIDKAVGPKSFTSLSLTSGFGVNQYTAVKAAKDSLNGKYPTFFTASFIRGEISYNYLASENFAWGVLLAYNMVLASYDPNLNCFATYENFSKYRNKVNMGWISFGINFYFAPKKRGQ